MREESRQLEGNKMLIDNNFILKIIIPLYLKVLLNFPEVSELQISIEIILAFFETKSKKTPPVNPVYFSK